MNPDTAPIEDVEAWLAPRLGWYAIPGRPGWHGKGTALLAGVLIGPSMDAAIACLPEGWEWECDCDYWMAEHDEVGIVSHTRHGYQAKARDELLRLAARAWMAQEENK